ncbi:uncharacterized transporter C38C10.2 [Fopius arisanus]|uniref:Uncharacterized transporter C38C10.2 n=1 Tax=Fopius arisanus TaxID=64838 RepID=A0A9R1T3G7_9HYME|nr:PREDICTED: uncharacterized transporter C38C10.2 [Fopius arisanus]
MSEPFTNYMRYVVAILGCAGGALINFVEYDSFYSGGLHPLFLEMVYYVALIQFPIPTAILAERTSAKSLMIVTMILKFASLVLLETQQYVRESYSIAVIIGRILQAYATAAFPPIMYLFIGRWSPPKDRGIMAMIIFSGLPIGSMFRLAPFFLWVIFQMRTFYVFGALALLWIVLFWLLVEDHPEADHWVSQKERTIILEQLHRSEGEYLRKLQPFPFKEVFTSMPFWVLLAVHSGLEGAFTVLKLFPKSIETTEGGNFLTIILMIIFGSSVTCLVKRNKVNLTQARKSTVAFRKYKIL